jgi:hypothetical protein
VEPPPVEEAPPVDDAPPPPPLEGEVDAAPPAVDEPDVSVDELEAPPPPPGAGVDGLPPELPEDFGEPEVISDDAGAADASAVMGPGQPGAEPLEDFVADDLGAEDVAVDELPAEVAPLEADWVSEGESPFAVSEREMPLDAIVGPGQPFELRFDEQQDNGYCAVCCAHTVVSEITGREVPREEIENRAAEGGWLSFGESGEVRGTSPEGLGDMLDSYGIATSQTSGEADAFDRLDQAIADDRRVIVPLDQPGFGAYGEDTSVAITAVDREAGTVLARDSAQGSPIQIPLDSFEQAWGESDYSLTSVDDAPYDVVGATLHPDFGLASSAEPLGGLPADGEAGIGDWWASAGDPVGCCQVPEQPADTPLEFSDGTGNVYQLPGLDTSGTGQADTAVLDANGDGQADTWMYDTTDTGQVDLMYYDSSGSGEPDSVSCCSAEGEWREPIPVTTALNAAVPGQQLAPVAIPQDQVPAEVVENYPELFPTADQVAANTMTVNIEPLFVPSLEQPTYTIVSPGIMAPTAAQQEAMPLGIPAWDGPGVDPYADIIDLLRSPSPASSGPVDLFQAQDLMSRTLASMDIAATAFTLPSGIERRYNPLTGSTIDVARGSMFP